MGHNIYIDSSLQLRVTLCWYFIPPFFHEGYQERELNWICAEFANDWCQKLLVPWRINRNWPCRSTCHTASAMSSLRTTELRSRGPSSNLFPLKMLMSLMPSRLWSWQTLNPHCKTAQLHGSVSHRLRYKLPSSKASSNSWLHPRRNRLGLPFHIYHFSINNSVSNERSLGMA